MTLLERLPVGTGTETSEQPMNDAARRPDSKDLRAKTRGTARTLAPIIMSVLADCGIEIREGDPKACALLLQLIRKLTLELVEKDYSPDVDVLRLWVEGRIDALKESFVAAYQASEAFLVTTLEGGNPGVADGSTTFAGSPRRTRHLRA